MTGRGLCCSRSCILTRIYYYADASYFHHGVRDLTKPVAEGPSSPRQGRGGLNDMMYEYSIHRCVGEARALPSSSARRREIDERGDTRIIYIKYVYKNHAYTYTRATAGSPPVRRDVKSHTPAFHSCVYGASA